eukprot:TRINITY_DN10024_c0_g1_i1.p1 TRINITY_DN10024_c0_g1~~TRINITY_DN10024_c0_g1_i1.p1  ORF type:complete len:491 (+),score=49.71 TRINITY_DN10024_c0_g1_i1:76-1548(+)
MNSAAHDFYDLLQISEGASPSEIRAGYRRAALLCHPDKGGTSETFLLLVRAFETLSDDAKRHSYDLRRGMAKRRVAHNDDDDAVPGCQTHASSNDKNSCKRDCSAAHPRGAGSFSSREKCDSTNGQNRHPTTRRLHVLLERLRRALQVVPSGRRRNLIELLDGQVKIHLVEWMEVRGSHGQDMQVTLVNSESDSEVSSSAAENSQIPRQGIGEIQAVCDLDIEEDKEMLTWQDLSESVPQSVEGSKRCARSQQTVSRGVQRYTYTNGDVRYRAVALISRLRFYTKPQPQLDIAIDQHIVLMQIRQALLCLVDEGADTSENIQSSVESVCMKNQMHADRMGLTASVCTTIGAKCLTTPILPWRDALQWRHRVGRCKFDTIEDFRALCLELHQHPARKVLYTKDRTEALVQAWCDRLQQHMERRVERAARAVAVAIKDVSEMQAREMRWCAVQEARKRRKLEVERREWLYRKPVKDMTMEDLRQRMPPHLNR